jgi:hypothetical protein
MLEDIYKDSSLKHWYFSILIKMNELLDSFGDTIDPGYLNCPPNEEGQFSNPVSVFWLKDLINDILWVLNKDEASPSNRFKFFEDDLE